MADHNANYVGGDITVGANSPGAIAGPTPRLSPLAHTDSQGTCVLRRLPGAGAHGMCGWYAASERCCAPSSASPACPLWAMS